MDAPVRYTEGEVVPAQPPEYCEYCGARLSPLLYFCANCATPYRPVEEVLTPARPVRLTDGQLIERKAPHVARLFWTFFAVAVGTAVLSYLLLEERRPDLAVILRSVAVTVTTCVFAVLHWPSLVVQFKRFGFGQPAALLSLAALAPLLGINYLYHGWLVEQLGAPRVPLLSRLREAGVGEPTLVFLVCVLPAVMEEIAFRGLVQHWLQIAIAPRRAIVLAAALFMALHFSVLSAPYLFAVGVLLGWAKWKTGSLYPSMLIHFLHNLIVLEFFGL